MATTAPTTNIDVQQLVAFDMHVHLEHTGTETTPTRPPQYFKKRRRARRRVARRVLPLAQDGVRHLHRRRTITGRPQVSNDEVAAFAERTPTSPSPSSASTRHAGQEAVNEAQRLMQSDRVRGLKLHPPLQEFFPNDRLAYPLYEVFNEARLPVIFHTGHSGIGTGMPGGGGIRLKYGNPMPIDDVAVDFPDMPIIIAHPSFPWQDEAISVCLHKPQVYIDLSGWSPKYFSATLVQYANTLLKHKVLFGSDYPLMTPDRWLADFEKIAIKDEVRPLILKENAIRLFGFGAA